MGRSPLHSHFKGFSLHAHFKYFSAFLLDFSIRFYVFLKFFFRFGFFSFVLAETETAAAAKLLSRIDG